MTRVAGIVLAAGSSVRMGHNKLLLELGGETVARRAVWTACAAGLAPVVVVTGHERGAVEAEVHDMPCRTVHNEEYATGQHTSVRAGVRALDAACAAAIVILADMPFVTSAMLRSVAARHAETRALLVASRYGADATAPPILYDRRLFGELARLDRRCGRRVVKRHCTEAVAIHWPLERMRDLDCPSDYESARRELAEAGRGSVHGSGSAHG